jgi:hypothetical protein
LAPAPADELKFEIPVRPGKTGTALPLCLPDDKNEVA